MSSTPCHPPPLCASAFLQPNVGLLLYQATYHTPSLWPAVFYEIVPPQTQPTVTMTVVGPPQRVKAVRRSISCRVPSKGRCRGHSTPNIDYLLQSTSASTEDTSDAFMSFERSEGLCASVKSHASTGYGESYGAAWGSCDNEVQSGKEFGKSTYLREEALRQFEATLGLQERMLRRREEEYRETIARRDREIEAHLLRGEEVMQLRNEAARERDEARQREAAMSSKMSELQDLVTCGVCFLPLCWPVQLSCGHCFCSSCITQWEDVTVKSGKALTCPSCRAPAGLQTPARALADICRVLEDPCAERRRTVEEEAHRELEVERQRLRHRVAVGLMRRRRRFEAVESTGSAAADVATMESETIAPGAPQETVATARAGGTVVYAGANVEAASALQVPPPPGTSYSAAAYSTPVQSAPERRERRLSVPSFSWAPAFSDTPVQLQRQEGFSHSRFGYAMTP